MTPEDRFWSKVDKDGPVPEHAPELGPCWLWTAGTQSKGYGVFWFEGRLVMAHRWSYEQEHTVELGDHDGDHLCRVHACVRPDHIDGTTRQENLRRGLNGALKTHCAQGRHPWTEENVYRRPSGKAYCRPCQHERRVAV